MELLQLLGPLLQQPLPFPLLGLVTGGGLGIFLWVRRLANTSQRQEDLIQDLELSSLRFRLLF